MTDTFAKKLIHYIDLTRLETHDSPEAIDQLCQKAVTPFGDVAAVCVYPDFITRAKNALANTNVRLATVANFPLGDHTLDETIILIQKAIQAGADEIDVVMPREGDVAAYLVQCRLACANRIMKVILETGALKEEKAIFEASVLAIQSGADFLKTSTGKIKIGATLSAAKTMLTAIQQFPKKTVGIKLSGGVRDEKTARDYWDLVASRMGEQWITPRTFRIGASSLLDELLS